MIREIKYITLGSGYDYIELDKYTNNKDLIEVRFEKTGEYFTDWTLNDTGTLRIELGVIDYKQYENPHSIKVVVDYEPSQLPVELEEIDTLEGLSRNIIDLKTLRYINNMRLVAYRKFNIKLKEFVILNKIILDQCGQHRKLRYEDTGKFTHKKVIELEEFKRQVNEYSSVIRIIPSSEDLCYHCHQKWSLDNFDDCIVREDNMYHTDCNKYSLYEKSKKQFEYIASEVFNNYGIHAIKNEYGSEDYNGSWFILTTEQGDIKIGWRKRVIQIEWLSNYKSFEFRGNKENVTKLFTSKERYIHAWTVEKAIEYLKVAKENIIK